MRRSQSIKYKFYKIGFNTKRYQEKYLNEKGLMWHYIIFEVILDLMKNLCPHNVIYIKLFILSFDKIRFYTKNIAEKRHIFR